MKKLAERMPGGPLSWFGIGVANLLLGAFELAKVLAR